MKVVYVAGKFRAKTAWGVAENVRAAERVGYEVAAAGAMPLIPHANTAHFDGTMTAEFWLEGTMELLRRCDAVVMVPGWRTSQGAMAEFLHAQELQLPVFQDGDPFDDLEAFKKWVASQGGATAGEVKATGVKPACTCTHAPEQHARAGCLAAGMFGKSCPCAWDGTRP